MTNNQMYHCLRMAFLCGEERLPWHLVCAALREALCPELNKPPTMHLIYKLQEKDYKKYPRLREFVEWLKEERTEATEKEAVRKINEEIQLRWHGEIKDSPLNPPKLD